MFFIFIFPPTKLWATLAPILYACNHYHWLYQLSYPEKSFLLLLYIDFTHLQFDIYCLCKKVKYFYLKQYCKHFLWFYLVEVRYILAHFKYTGMLTHFMFWVVFSECNMNIYIQLNPIIVNPVYNERKFW